MAGRQHCDFARGFSPSRMCTLRLAYNLLMATGYTDDHAKSGLDFRFPAIETWPNQFPGYEILIDDPEFTSVCPKTSLPDFGIITLRYCPRDRCLELKSYKEYLFCYREPGNLSGKRGQSGA